MASIYDIDYNTKAVELSSPDKRGPVEIGWLQALLSPMQWIRNKMLSDYRCGSAYPLWVPASYPVNALVVYNQVIYQSLINNNTDQPPSANWMVYLPSFIGVNTRVKFNGIKLTLEYALNKRFATNFRQPTNPLYPHVSDIYITSTPYIIRGFVVGKTVSSTVGKTESEIGSLMVGVTVGGGAIYYQPYLFNIMIPVAVFNALNTNNGAIAEITGFVTPLCPTGTTFSITTY